MKTAYCPYCNNHTLVDNRDWGLMIQCEAPRCERFFLAGAPAAQRSDADQVAAAPVRRSTQPPAHSQAPPPPQRATSPSKPEPHLTGPHRCQVCHDDIPRALGRRRATVLHQPDRARWPDLVDNCRTDIYAAIYRCPSCREVLETPRYQWGRPITCPLCQADFTAPFDDVLHRHEGDACEGPIFRFPCPACAGALRCDTRRQGLSTRDLPVVCVHCHHVITVPGAGFPVAGLAGHDGQQPAHRCPNPACAQMIPGNCDVCPLCGTVCAPPLIVK
jgi:hypothetical protein